MAAYVEGINNAAKSMVTLPSEYLLLAARFEPWTALDTFLIAEFTGFGISPHWASTILRSYLADGHGIEAVRELMHFEGKYSAFNSTYTIMSEEQVKLRSLETLKPSSEAGHDNVASGTGTAEKESANLGPGPVKIEMGLGLSNSWAISGNFTKNGKPLLAGDPHIGASLPSIFYAVNLKLARNKVTGFVIPGAPALAFGRTDYAAWAATSSYVENTDIYYLKLDSAQQKYFHDGVWKKLEVYKNVIKVKNGKDILYPTYATHHGAVVFPANQQVAMSLPEP